MFVVKSFRRFQRKERISDEALCEAIGRAERGLVDADLGGGLIKQRVARQGQGRSGGYRTIIAYRSGERSVFLNGFAKNTQANITRDEEDGLKDFGMLVMQLDEDAIEQAVSSGELVEIEYDDEG